jgi:arsenite methyltransferase
MEVKTMSGSEEMREAVREHYGKVASQTGVGCAPNCCGGSPQASLDLGYTPEDLAAVPDGANLGLGCGNPMGIAALRDGETVLDLGSGAGFDCFLAARRVGPHGHVIGVDMTAPMIAKARANAETLGTKNVEFRLGEIERLPVADASVDVILSNCVVNLSPDKAQVYRDAFRVLRAGGRIAISDVVLVGEIAAELKNEVAAFTGCVSGAASVKDVERMLTEAGFTDIRVTVKEQSRRFIEKWLPGTGIENSIASADIEAIKPRASACCAPSCCGD